MMERTTTDRDDVAELAAALSRATEAVLNLAPLDGTGPFAIPMRPVDRVVRTHTWGGGGSEGARIDQVPDPDAIIAEKWNEIGKLSAVGEFLACVRAKERVPQRPLDTKVLNSPLPVLEHLAANALSRAIRCNAMRHDRLACSLQAGERLLASLSTAMKINFVIAPVFNLDSKIPTEIDLPWGITLRRITQDEADELAITRGLAEQFRPPLPLILRTYSPTWALTFPNELKWDHGPSLWEIVSSLEYALSLFRLVKSQRLAIAYVLAWEYPGAPSTSGTQNYYFPPQGAWSFDDLPFEVQPADVNDISRLMSLVTALPTGGAVAGLEVALSRLRDVYVRLEERDQVIDSIIAMEALLLSNETEEKSFRFALNGSILLANDSDERIKVRNTLKSAYRRRSILVHSGLDKHPVPLTHEIVATAKRVVRRAIELSDVVPPNRLAECLERYVIELGPGETFEGYARRRSAEQRSG